MIFEFDDKLVEEINNSTKELLYCLLPDDRIRKKTRPISSIKHRVMKKINLDDVKEISTSRVDEFGKQSARYFPYNGKQIGLSGENYFRFETICENIGKVDYLQDIISLNYIENILFQWFKGKYNGSIDFNADFWDYFVSGVENDVKNREIIIPIDNLMIDLKFQIGNVIIDYLSTEQFDKWEKKLVEGENQTKKDAAKNISIFRNKYQGMACSFVNINAEIDKSIDIAKIETEKALMVLRFFSPTAFVPEIPMYTGCLGNIIIPSYHQIIIEEDKPSFKSQFDDNKQQYWSISGNYLKRLKLMKLDNLSTLVAKRKTTEFEEHLLKSFHLFDRSVVSHDLHDKLVFNIAAIETLLYDNNRENLAVVKRRYINFVSSGSKKQQEKTSRIYNTAQSTRGSFIHQGNHAKSFGFLKEFQNKIWAILHFALVNKDQFPTKETFFGYMDDLSK